VHARTRDQKGQNTGLADWTILSFLRKTLPEHTILFGNGNVLEAEDFDNCISQTGVNGVLSAEGALSNPAIFLPPQSRPSLRHPRVDEVAREYLGLCKELSETRGIRSHLFKLLRGYFLVDPQFRDQLTRARSPDDFERFISCIEASIAEKLEQDGVVRPYLQCNSYIRRDRLRV